METFLFSSSFQWFVDWICRTVTVTHVVDVPMVAFEEFCRAKTCLLFVRKQAKTYGHSMNRGAWHQCGDKSQKLVVEQLEAGHGAGVILSPRDLTRDKAVEYAAQYAALHAPVLIDPQFYVPDFTNDNLDTYGLSAFRTTLATLGQITDVELSALSTELETLGSELGVWAVVAPAAMYEAGRPDIAELNARLFAAAKSAGDALGVPTLASVTLARSVTGSNATVSASVDAATALPADGWYYAFEFEEERIPSSREAVRRCCGHCGAPPRLDYTAKPEQPVGR